MKEILKGIKRELIQKLSGSYFIEIKPPDTAKITRWAVSELPFIAIAPFNTAREVESTLLIRPDHTVQITVLDHYPYREESIVGDADTKGMLGHVTDIIKILEFSTLGIDGMAKGAIIAPNIIYESLPREPDLFQIATITLSVQGVLEQKS